MPNNVCVIELAEDGNSVRFCESKHVIGNVNDEHVINMLRSLEYDMMSASLTRHIWQYRDDVKCCPVCGCKEVNVRQIIDGVSFGFCSECLTTIHVANDGSWQSFPFHPPYKRRYNRLTEEDE